MRGIRVNGDWQPPVYSGSVQTGVACTPVQYKQQWFDDCHIPPQVKKTLQANTRRKARKARTPDWAQHIRHKKVNALAEHHNKHKGPKQGALVDGASSSDHVGAHDVPYVTGVHDLETPEVYDTVNGTATVTQEGSITYGDITLPHTKLMPSSKESLASLQTGAPLHCISTPV